MKVKNIQHYSRFTDKGPSIAERVIKLYMIYLKKVFLKGNADWITELPSVINKYNNTIHSSIKMSPNHASKKIIEEVVLNNLRDKRIKNKPQFQRGQIVRNADIKKVFSKGDSTNYSYDLNKNRNNT